jgi:hypothetical protein
MTPDRSGTPREFRMSPLAAAAAALGLATVTIIVLIRPAHSASSPPVASGSTSHSVAVSTTVTTGPAPTVTALARTAPPITSSPAVAWPWLAALPTHTTGHLQPGSDPRVLPADLLIADKLNNRLVIVDPQGRVRWEFPRPGDLAPGQTFLIPDDAFFSADGRDIIATQEDDSVISIVDVLRHRIVWRYGTPGVPGSGPNQLSNPDDALMLRNREVLTADIKNCRMLLIAPGTHQPEHIIGTTTTDCFHAPPAHWGSPNGIFPLRNGHFVVTEINGDWVDEIGLNGTVYWSVHPPDVGYPSDTNEISPGRLLTVDYSSPGQVLIFDRHGTVFWRFRSDRTGTLDHPSLALPLPNGDVVVNDDYNHRVVVIDPRTSRVVWQYGVLGVAGSAPGYLNNPDGMDLVPPDSLITRTTR